MVEIQAGLSQRRNGVCSGRVGVMKALGTVRAGVAAGVALAMAVPVVGAALAVTSPTAAASGTLTTFDGNCSTAGTFSVAPSVGFIPQTGVHHYAGSGVCSGTLDGAAIVSAPVTFEGSAPEVYSCGVNTDVKEPVVLTFFPGSAHAESLHAFQTLVGAGSIYVPLIQGASSGDAYGILTVPFNSQTLTECLAQGVSSLPISITISTISTLDG
jgi:hypothetical protein